jgi:hypothetical protein
MVKFLFDIAGPGLSLGQSALRGVMGILALIAEFETAIRRERQMEA